MPLYWNGLVNLNIHLYLIGISKIPQSTWSHPRENWKKLNFNGAATGNPWQTGREGKNRDKDGKFSEYTANFKVRQQRNKPKSKP